MIRTVETVIGVQHGLLDQPLDVRALGFVEDLCALASGRDEAGESELGEVLGYRGRLRSDVVGEFVDRVLSMQERPDDSETGRVGQ